MSLKAERFLIAFEATGFAIALAVHIVPPVFALLRALLA
ncbi:hypothetical protein ABIC44_001001 [Sphingomonas sp. 1185]